MDNKTFTNLNRLWTNTLCDIRTYGCDLESRVGGCREIIGFQAGLTEPINNILFIPQRKFSLSYACAEMLWYLSGTGKIDMIQAYAPQYEKFAENGWAYGAYGNRWSHNPGFIREEAQFIRDTVTAGEKDNTNIECFRSQLYALIHLLKTKPNTRQAIMTMWDSGDLVHAILGDHKDLPCTLSLCFFVRSNELHLVATMRSNDAWLGLPYDVFCFTTLQRIIAVELRLNLGTYIHQAGSEHIYIRNMEKINEILRSPRASYPCSPGVSYHIYEKRNHTLDQNIKWALIMEKEIRGFATLGSAYGANKKILTKRITEKVIAEQKIKRNEAWEKIDPIFKDLVFGCATKWIYVPNEWFNNPFYAKAQQHTEEVNE